MEENKIDETIMECSEKPVLDLKEKIRVLHVDDDIGLLKVAKQCLEMETTIHVDTSLSVEEAFKKMEKEKYDVIISDYKMPLNDGLEFLKELREKGNSIPFIMFTGRGREEVAIRALNLGASQYLSKTGETQTVYAELAHTITELAKTRKAEEKLSESEEKFRNLFEKANDGLIFIDPSGRIVDANHKAAEIAEKRKEDLVGKSFLDLSLVNSKNAGVLVEKLKQQANGKPTERFEFEIEKEDGEKRLVEITASVIQNNTVPAGSLAIVRDITERKRMEEAFQKREMELRAQFYGSPDLIMILDRKHRYVRINRTHFLSYEVGRLIGGDAIEPLPPNQRDLATSKVDQCFATGDIQEFEHTLQHGEWVRARVVPLRSADKVDQVMIISTDITERKKTEQELRRFSSAVKASLDCIITGDLNGNISDVNEATLKLYGSNDKKDLIGKNVQELLVERDRTKALRNSMDIIQTRQGKTVEYTALTKNGIEVPIEVTTQLLEDEKGEPAGFVDIIRDLTGRKRAEEALKESEERYSRLSAAAFEGIGISEQGKITDANDQLAKMLGYEISELIGKDALEMVAPESRDLVAANMRNGYDGPYEHLALRKDGSVFPVEVRARPVHYNGHTRRVSVIREITERKKAERDMRKAVSLLMASEERYRGLFENSKDLMISYDLKGNITAVNRVATEYGFARNEYAGKSMFEFVPETEWPRLHDEVDRILQGKSVEGEIEIDTPKGKRTFEYISSPIKERGEIVGIHGSYKDITKRKRAEEALRVSEERYRKLNGELQRFSTAVKASVDGIIMCDMEGRIVEVNRAALKLYDTNEEKDLLGKNSLELAAPEEIEKLAKKMKETVTKGFASAMEVNALTVKGEKILLEVTSTLMKDAEGHPAGFLSIVRDLTERKEQHRLMEESQQKFAALFRGNPEATVYADPNMHILDINPRFESLFGYSLDEIRGKHIDDVVVPENLLEEGRMLNEKASEGQVYRNTQRKKKDGSLIPVSVSAAPIHLHDKLIGYVWLYKDISQQETAKESLKESEEKLKALFAGAPEASIYLGLDFRIQNANRRFEQLFGYSLDEIKGKHIDDVIVQKGKKEEATMLNEKAAEGYVYHDTLRRRKNGSLVPVSISAAPIVIKGQLSGFVGTYKDISDLKNAEEKLAVMNEKLRVVGGLTRHDVRNKLSIITGNTYLMRKKLKDHPEVTEGFEDVESACATIVKLLEFARDYERLGVEELTYMDLEDSIEKAVSLFMNTDQTKIVNECHGLNVLADSLLTKLFYNLIDNSLKHGGHVTHIGISSEESGNELMLTYEDNGVGITQEAKQKLFTEGYTTGKGSGYGLYLIRKMMEAYGWSIQEKGSPGNGTRFLITIPKLNKQGKQNYKFNQPRAPTAQ